MLQVKNAPPPTHPLPPPPPPGAWLGYNVGPKFSVTREVDIPEGSMMVPQDAKEVVVVVDMRGGAKKVLGVMGYAAALLTGITLMGLARTHLIGH